MFSHFSSNKWSVFFSTCLSLLNVSIISFIIVSNLSILRATQSRDPYDDQQVWTFWNCCTHTMCNCNIQQYVLICIVQNSGRLVFRYGWSAQMDTSAGLRLCWGNQQGFASEMVSLFLLSIPPLCTQIYTQMHVRVHQPYLHGSVWSQYLCWGSQMFFASWYEDQLFTNEKTTLSEQVCPSYSITYRIHKAGVHCRHIYSVLFGHELPVPMDIYSTDCSKSNTSLYLCFC